MNIFWKWFLGIVGVAAILLIAFFVWPGPQFLKMAREIRSTEIAESVIGVQAEELAATEEPVFEPTATLVPPTETPAVESAPEVAEKGCPARVVIEPPADAYVSREGNKTYSFSYDLKENLPYDVPVSCGSTATMAFGNAIINGKSYEASEEEGNVVYSTCDQPLGCNYVVEDFTPGHFNVTVAYPGMEKPQDTVYNAVSNMFEPSNCGGSGCNRAFMTDADHSDETTVFEVKPKKAEVVIDGFMVEPTQGSVIGEPESKTITVGGREVGYHYILTGSGTQYIGVPETNEDWITGLSISCIEGCTVYGTTIEAGKTAVVYGNSGDGNTPEDLNWTVAVDADNLASVEVFFIFADDVDLYVSGDVYEFNSDGFVK